MSIENEKWYLPTELQVTPEMLEDIAQQQKIWRARAQLPYASLSPQEMARNRSLTLVPEILESLAQVTDPETIKVLKQRLAEAYATQGRYDLAAETTPDNGQRAEYAAIWAAVMRDDSEWCTCPKVGRVTQTFVKQEIWDVRTGKVMPLLKCNTCGGMNVRPLTPALVEQQRMGQLAAKLARGKSPQEARRILTERGLTTEALSKRRHAP